MPKVILQPDQFRRLLRRRRECGGDRHDEVWNGVYVMSPLADNEHQKLGRNLANVVEAALGDDDRVQVFHGCNVSDRPADWRKNYRCPDVAVFLPGNPAEDRRSHWYGGPDLAVEIISPRDRSRKKFGFYAAVNVRELLLVGRRPWCLELYRRRGDQWELVGKCRPGNASGLASAVLPVTFRLLPGEPRPLIEVTHADGERRWLA